MNLLEAKPLDKNAESWKRESQLFTLTEPNRTGTHALRSCPTVWSVFVAQTFASCFKLALLVIKGLYLPNETQNQRNNCQSSHFWHCWLARNILRSIAAVRRRPRIPQNWRCSFAFCVSFFWHFNKNSFQSWSSRPVFCKNQENSAGKQWSLHAPLKRHLIRPERSWLTGS